MENPLSNKSSSRNLTVNNFVTCLYLSAIVLYLNYTDRLFDIEIYRTTQLPLLLASAEILKYAFFWYNQAKVASKKHEPKKNRLKTLTKSVFVIATTLVMFYAVAVLFGAPFYSKQFHTLSFASIMTVLTALPCVLYLGPNSVFDLFISLTKFEGDNVYEKFLLSIRLTVFGAWLGAVVIPLDWNRPYQEWPIPCYLGSIAGCALANFILILKYFSEVPPKKTHKV